MRIGVLGAGTVGQTLAAKLRELGHDVSVGTRNPRDGAVSYAEAAESAELLVNATNGNASLEALDAAGAENLSGKVLIDVSNALDFSKGRPPIVGVSNDDSIGEQIQRAHPNAKVVKALHTVNAEVMVDPSKVPGEHVLFVCGNDEAAKAQVVELLDVVRLAIRADPRPRRHHECTRHRAVRRPVGPADGQPRHSSFQHLAEPRLTRPGGGRRSV